MAFRARLLIIILLHFNPIHSANILFLLPVPSPSHRLWNNVLIEGLEELGHNLTIVTVEQELSRKNVTFICIRNVYEELHEYHKTTYWSLTPKSSLTTIKENYEFGNFVSRKVFASDELKRLKSYPKSFKFHAIIYDFSMAQSMLAFVEHFNFPPLISVSPLSLPQRLSYVSSTEIFPSYIAHYSTMNTPVTLRKRISERFMNGFIYHTFDWFFARFVYMKNENARVATMFGNENKIKLEQLEYSDLVLINRDFYFDDILPLPPTVVLVAALQAERKNEIPNDVR
jgi:glucuronosyltransferase